MFFIPFFSSLDVKAHLLTSLWIRTHSMKFWGHMLCLLPLVCGHVDNTHCVGGCELTLRFSVVLMLPSGLGASGKCVQLTVNHISRSTPESVKTHLTDGNTDVIGRHVATQATGSCRCGITPARHVVMGC